MLCFLVLLKESYTKPLQFNSKHLEKKNDEEEIKQDPQSSKYYKPKFLKINGISMNRALTIDEYNHVAANHSHGHTQ